MEKAKIVLFALLLTTFGYGQDWEELNSPAPTLFQAVDFTSEDIGFIVSQTGEIFRTEDKGETWRFVYEAPSGPLYDIDFVNPQIGFASGLGTAVNYTTDGGLTWQYYESLPQGLFGYGLDFVTERVGYICGTISNEGKIFKTEDGGITWHEQQVEDVTQFYDIQFDDEKNGYCSGRLGVICRTSNGGETWEKLSFPERVSLFGIARAGHSIFLAGTNGRIYKSTDEGEQWVRQETGTSGTIFDIVFHDAVNGVAAGDSIILETHNCGFTWEEVQDVDSYQNKGVCATPGAVFIVGQKGKVFRKEIRKDQQAEEHLMLFPNPNDGKFRIEFNNPDINLNGLNIEIFDFLGRPVAARVEWCTAGVNVELSSSEMAGYGHIVRIRSGAFEESRKVIVLK